MKMYCPSEWPRMNRRMPRAISSRLHFNPNTYYQIYLSTF